MKRAWSWLISLLLIAGFFWLFPPFRVVSLHQSAPQAFSAAAFAAKFWETQLLPATSRAASLTEVLAALSQDASAARQKFGRSLGLGSTTCFFVKGAGKVVAVGKDGVKVAVEGAASATEIQLTTGLLFGNTIRDATGLLDASDYPNSQDFNDISSELNHIVETRVLPALSNPAIAGKRIQFTGCFELDEGASLASLEIIPVKIEWP